MYLQSTLSQYELPLFSYLHHNLGQLVFLLLANTNS